jgi:phosphoglycerol transferase MdoB-like AlkP superfamily enzyme
LKADFFRQGQPTLNFVITRSAHLSYKYNEVLSYWALKQYPEFRGKTGNEELDCMYLKAKLVDDMFARLLEELEARGELENTVIVAVTDHYAYGFKNVDLMLAESGVEDTLLLEKTPCFIWSADGPDIEVEKVLNTSDLLPTVLNLMGVESPHPYIGKDAFDARYPGYALFPNGSWICDGVAYSATTGDVFYLRPGKTADPAWMGEMSALVSDFVRINNLILETDYYKESK